MLTTAPVGFVSYRVTSAGLRAVEMIKPVLISLNMVPIHEAVSVPLRLRLNQQGEVCPDQVMVNSARRLLTELALLTVALAPLRKTKATQQNLLALAS